MPRPLRLLLLLGIAVSTFAQSAGAPFPLTNTRYGASRAEPLLRSNGQDLLLFSVGPNVVRVAKLVDGQERTGEQVFTRAGDFDAVFTGSEFVAMTATDSPQRILGRRLDRDGHPLGAAFVVADHAAMPRLAAGHGRVLVLYRNYDSGKTRVAFLQPNNTLADAPVTIDEPWARATATANGFLIVSAGGPHVVATTLDPQGNLVAERVIRNVSPGEFDVALATHGSESLAVWTNYAEIGVARIAGNGSPGAPLIVEEKAEAGATDYLYAGHPSAVWNDGWTVAYHTGRHEPRVHVVSLDARAEHVLEREDAPERTRTPSIALFGTRVIAAWTHWLPSYFASDVAYVTDLPLEQNEAREASFGAMEQTLLTATASANATLAVWQEAGDQAVEVRTGVRTHDGQWRERQLIDVEPPSYSVRAASDGRNFLVVIYKRAYLLDETGAPTRAAIVLPSYVDFMTWNGESYVLFSPDGARFLTPAGALSAPVQLPIGFAPLAAASDGTGLLVAGGNLNCQFLLCYPVDARAVRLTRNLARVDAEELLLAPDITVLTGVVWNGAEYVVAFDTGVTTSLARVPATAGAAARIEQPPIAPATAGAISATTDGSIALLATTNDSRSVMFIGRDGAVNGRASVQLTSSPDFLLPLPSGAVAVLNDEPNHAPPHYGAWRLLTSIVSRTAVVRPGAPQITARDEGSRILANWTAPAGTINGYRLEYRVDDGVWIELERWFAPGEQSISLRKPAFATTFELRARALNDAGAGAYSNVAKAQTPRKARAIRVR